MPGILRESLLGTLCFGVFSLRYFSPVWGMVAVMAMYFIISSRKRWLLDTAVFAAVLGAMFLTSEPGAIWSPYHYITVTKFDTPDVPESAPPADLLTMVDPPVYSVHVNHFYYHYNLSMDLARHSRTSKEEHETPRCLLKPSARISSGPWLGDSASILLCR